VDDLILLESRNFQFSINSVGTKHELVADLLHCFYFASPNVYVHAFVILASKAEHFHGSTISLSDVLCFGRAVPCFYDRLPSSEWVQSAILSRHADRVVYFESLSLAVA
jgi:hypothetical protein